jgi:hypothetical protein
MYELNFSKNEHRLLAEKIIDGEIVLYTGAGFSLGAISRKKKNGEHINIPTVSELKVMLNEELLKNTADVDEDSLKELCGDCKRENQSLYERFMKLLFETKEVKDFHYKYSEFKWKNIYTVNVDQVLDKIFECDKLVIQSGRDPLHTVSGDIVVTKLHGDAVKNPANITFTTTEYAINATGNDDRFDRLNRDLKTENFLFIGTRLSDEIDFDIRCIKSNLLQIPNRMYFVIKDVNEKWINRLNDRFANVEVIEESAESFINKIIEYRDNNKKKVSCKISKKEFKKIDRNDYKDEFYLQPNIYLGNEPTWHDIVNNHDVIWKSTHEYMQKINECKKNIIFIKGSFISGKTTLLYRYAINACAENEVYEYVGDNIEYSLHSILRYADLNQNKRIIILIDDASRFIDSIQWIIDSLSNKIHVKIVMVIREKEWRRKQHLFTNEVNKYVDFIHIKNYKLNYSDAFLFFEKKKEKTFLEIAHKSTNDIAREYVNKYKNFDRISALFFEDSERKHDRLYKEILELEKIKNYNIKRFIVYLYVVDVLGNARADLYVFLNMFNINGVQINEFISMV